ncbi:hypothetical protein CCR97_08320 [Rhodoplanes elegans]|uniref:NlpC/P60 domain-containing protein n=1 Tax=Rhodoplanes elegans TaxID=29408 RepID=A0A327KV91_9BRAD|nr:NlpC/P60 family protein [Rhodoplanes elegans]MBK5958123.1 hypothetical protein [Rhodoplanes elegans]MBK5958215.1 hypothetical protein [Rhodoplanes elegans]RAI41996.1 hypothetical protein CH338_01460 [Rhodoplanes elegans]
MKPVTDRHWSAAWLGIPYLEAGLTRAGASCWGLVRLVYDHELGITLPSYAGAPCEAERAEIAGALAGDAAAWPWREVPVDRAEPFDLMLFRYGLTESHVGLVAWPGHHLHVMTGITSRIEAYRRAPWDGLVSRVLRHVNVG